MISKELLSEVLSSNVQDIDYEFMSKSFSESVIRYYSNGKDYLINIYELAHKCKEWAYNKGGIDITSGKRLGLDGWECLVFTGVIPCDCYTANTEPEAIFLACEWIMENRK